MLALGGLGNCFWVGRTRSQGTSFQLLHTRVSQSNLRLALTYVNFLYISRTVMCMKCNGKIGEASCRPRIEMIALKRREWRLARYMDHSGDTSDCCTLAKGARPRSLTTDSMLVHRTVSVEAWMVSTKAKAL